MTIKEIDDRLEEGQSLKAIAQAYSDIANLKIKSIRSEVERNRLFFDEMSKVYGLVRAMAIKKGLDVKKSKKMVAILVTSNYRFYGNINSDLIDFFIKNTKNLDTDKILIGKAGLDYFKATNIFVNFKPVILKKDVPDSAEISSLINLIKDYSQVLIIHSKLRSLLIQQPVITDITPSVKASSEIEDFRFIFEPELAKILTFFDSSILTLLLEETFLESELSRTASRFISMDKAETEANKSIKELGKLRALTKRDLENNKILENYASQVGSQRRMRRVW